MRYIELNYDANYCGTQNTEYLATDMTDKELDEYALEATRSNAEMYEYMVLGWDEDVYSYAEENDMEIEEVEEMIAEYYENICYDWHEITEEEYKEMTE
jgi:hypothetical protein